MKQKPFAKFIATDYTDWHRLNTVLFISSVYYFSNHFFAKQKLFVEISEIRGQKYSPKENTYLAALRLSGEN